MFNNGLMAMVENLGDCHVAYAPRNDRNFHVIAKEELATTAAISLENTQLPNVQMRFNE